MTQLSRMTVTVHEKLDSTFEQTPRPALSLPLTTTSTQLHLHHLSLSSQHPLLHLLPPPPCHSQPGKSGVSTFQNYVSTPLVVKTCLPTAITYARNDSSTTNSPVRSLLLLLPLCHRTHTTHDRPTLSRASAVASEQKVTLSLLTRPFSLSLPVLICLAAESTATYSLSKYEDLQTHLETSYPGSHLYNNDIIDSQIVSIVFCVFVAVVYGADTFFLAEYPNRRYPRWYTQAKLASAAFVGVGVLAGALCSTVRWPSSPPLSSSRASKD